MAPFKVKSISDLLQLRGLGKPLHPLICIGRIDTIKHLPKDVPVTLVPDFYMIGLKKFLSKNVKIKYGQQEYDFDEGLMSFMTPGQVFGFDPNQYEELNQSGWMLLIHPDFFWNTPLATKIRQYEFFSYAVNEALFLSEKEEIAVTRLFENIEQEYNANIDKFSQDIIISLIESLLSYAERFYNRQFITRKISNHTLLQQLQTLLEQSFSSQQLAANGVPTVKYVSEQLNISPNYLSGLLKMLTGKSTQHHIQDKIIDFAKERLAATNLSVSEIAFELGFDYPQSFSKLFKTKTSQSPLEFRKSVN
jgi:AraC-like DNA-binding protein